MIFNLAEFHRIKFESFIKWTHIMLLQLELALSWLPFPWWPWSVSSTASTSCARKIEISQLMNLEMKPWSLKNPAPIVDKPRQRYQWRIIEKLSFHHTHHWCDYHDQSQSIVYLSCVRHLFKMKMTYKKTNSQNDEQFLLIRNLYLWIFILSKKC